MGDPAYIRKIVTKKKTLKQEVNDREAQLLEQAKQIKEQKIKEKAHDIREKAVETLKKMGFSDFVINRDYPLVKTAAKFELAREKGDSLEMKKNMKELITARKENEEASKIVKEVEKGIGALNYAYGTNLSIEKMKPGTPEHDSIFMRVFRMNFAETAEEKSKIVNDLTDYMKKYVEKKRTEQERL